MVSTFGRNTHHMPREDYAGVTLAVAALKTDPQAPAATDTENLKVQWQMYAIPRPETMGLVG